MSTTILGIESSCDETSASICRDGKVINNIVATQSVHEDYGGVVPELASREHQKNIVPVVQKAIDDAGISIQEIDGIAVTQGPGLLGALLVGYSFAKSLACSLDIPLINVHHMHAHIFAHFIEEPTPQFPFLCLTVSGGHSQIVKITDYSSLTVLGATIDDAVGEAFDKGAKLLGLPYPGGPHVDKLAKSGDPYKFKFSESNLSDYNYSFSGIKTSLLYFLKKELKDNPDFITENLEDLCASYQYSLLNMLLKKLELAAKDNNIHEIAIAGGVAANQGLRNRLQEMSEKENWTLHFPGFEYCTDNAGMIAMTGYIKYKEGKFGSYRDAPKPRMQF
ncbi:MAG: tRNA (adenosine(37)-N6)-threonylcarbamoyltransferase complex transferase subunit TsaD [Cyclobacteriaceae bacterium]